MPVAYSRRLPPMTPSPSTTRTVGLRSCVALATFAVALVGGPLAAVPLGTVPAGAVQPAIQVDPVAGVEVADTFEIRHYDVSAEAASADSGSTDPGSSHALAMAATTTIEVALDGAPEMVILDHIEGPDALQLRSLNDGEWSEWVELEVESEDAPDGLPGEEGSVAAQGSVGPIWIGDGAESIELSVPRTAGASLRVEALTSLDTSGETEVTGDAVVGNAAIMGQAAASQPTIRPRSDWATAGWASSNSGCNGGPWYSDSVQAVVVHHTVNSNTYSADQSDDLLRGIYRYHVSTQGWCDIAYNFLVDRFGVIWEGRSGGTDQPVIGGHARGFNTATTGIALLGQHQAGGSPAGVAVSSAAASAVERLASWKLGLYGVDPLGTTWLQNRSSGAGMKFAADQWVEVPTILGHRDLGETSCPGSLAYPLVASMRASIGVTGQQIGTAPYVFPGWEGASSGASVVVVDTAGGVRPAIGADVPDPAPTIGSGAIAIAGSGDAGYVLTSAGDLRAYGGAPAIGGRPAGTATVIDVAVSSAGGGWILTSSADLVAFGGAPARSVASKPASGAARAVVLDGNGNGYVVDVNGRLSAVGSAPAVSSLTVSNAIDVALRPDGRSGWVLSADMKVYAFGGAPNLSVKPGSRSTARAIVASATGYGGWVLDAEGRLLAFGDVPYAAPISTTVGHQIAVDAAVVGYKLAPDLTTSTDGKLAKALYQTFVGETLSGPLLDHWARRVDDEGVGDVANALADSDDWAGAVVTQIYQTALGRAPDAAGRAYWVDQLSDGMKVQELGTFFYGSNEYFARAGSAGAYVDALYAELLHRTADSAGRAFWVAQIEQRGDRPAEVAAGFYASLESRRDRVSALFQKVLGRGPDTAGHEFWAEWLVTGDDIDLAANLASSEEYINRATR